jgi:transaldolase / glucose-6-phosphate isomerase
MAEIREALARIEGEHWLHLGEYQAHVDEALAQLEARRASHAIWGRHGELWSDDPQEAHEIEQRLGWLDLPDTMRIEIPRLQALAIELQAVGMRRALLLGMGGSSLAPEVLRHVLGVAPGFLDLAVLDTTDPEQIARVSQEDDLTATVFIAASKSGTTAETRTLMEYFAGELEALVGQEWPRHFIVITDPGTPLADLAEEQGLRACYINPPDVGGRYSALSLFGLVPAALSGIEGDRLLRSARAMAGRCGSTTPDRENPAAILGAIMAACARLGRDKLTLLTSPSLTPMGWWVEQLIAESTGKDGKGILPVEGEPPMELAAYGPDRLLVYVRSRRDDNAASDELAARLVEAGHPLVAIPLETPDDLGGEFFRWEFATAVAGYLLGINPFDQPNVDAAKQRALQALERYEETGQLDEAEPTLQEGGLALYGDAEAAGGAAAYLARFLGAASPGDYVALMAYVDRNEAHGEILQRIRHALAAKLGLAVTVGFGPRFLHSTGQIHKGGPNTGIFVQITHAGELDLEIPGRGYSFGVLKASQAAGDLAALTDRGRRVLRVDLRGEAAEGLRELERVLGEALA